jgi:hypothetical protein
LALLNNNHDDLIRLEDVFCMKTDPKDDYKNVWKFLLDVKYCKAMSKDRALRFLIDFYGSIDHRFRYDEPPYVYPDWLMLQETMGLTQDNIQKIIIDMNKEDTISSSTVVQRLSDFSWVIGFPFAETWNNKKINLIKQAKDDITETMFEYRALGLSDKEILEFIGVLPEPPSSSSYYDRTPSVTTLKAFLMLSGYFSGSEIVELYRSFDPDALNTMYTRSDRKPSLLIRILLLYFSNHSKKTILEVLKEMTIIIEKTEGRLDIIPYSRTFSQNLEAYREKWPELAENLKVLTKLLEKATKEEE